MSRVCPDAYCKSENIMDMDEGAFMCEDCGKELTEADFKYQGYKIGVVVSVEEKSKLKVCKVDVGDGQGNELQIVTNAKHVNEGEKVIVATERARVPAGADADDESAITVAKATVGGNPSFGMLCDCPMLGWTGGAAGQVVTLKEGEVGAAPPSERPRGK